MPAHDLDAYGGERGHVDMATFAYLQTRYGVRSALDLGCGPGTMLREVAAAGVDVSGMDGHAGFADDNPPIRAHDLERGTFAHHPIDLIWCHEVAEHLDSYTLGYFVQTLAAGRVLMLSAATPGIGGVHHVNEQQPSYWIRLLTANGWALDAEATGHIREIGDSWFIRHHGLVFVRGAA